MPAEQLAPTIRDGNFIVSETGLAVPRTYSRSGVIQMPVQRGPLEDYWSNQNYPAQGQPIPRDENTQVVRWFRKGSGLDDRVNEAIVDGNAANVGIAPVIHPMISALVVKQMNQAATATLDLVGRKTPVGKARAAVSRFNDSPTGATSAVMQMVHDLRTFNRGAPIATVPIMYDMSVWDDYGMEAVPIADNQERYYLRVDWRKFGTPTPFLPSVFDLEPTGDKLYPYWYRARYGDKRRWVLLHQSQIIEVLPGRTHMPGVGTSSTWMCIGWLAEDILVIEERNERKINAVSAGLVGISGIQQTASSLKQKMEEDMLANKEAGNLVSKAYTMLVSPSQEIKFVMMRLREEDGIRFEERRMYHEDVTALCFNVPLSEVVVRGGVGYGAQSDTAADVSSDSGVGALLHQIAVALGSIYPTVQFAFKRPNDRAQRLNINTLKEFSEAMKALEAGGGEVLTTAEKRAIIQREMIDIPDTQDSTVATATNEDRDSQETTEPEEENNREESRNNRKEMQAFAIRTMQIEPVIPEDDGTGIPVVEPDPEAVDLQQWNEDFPDYEDMLQAEVREASSADEIEEGGSGWLWLTGAWFYLEQKTRRRVDRSETVMLRDRLPVLYQPRLDDLAGELARGEITLQEWNRLTKWSAERAYTYNYLMGRGGQNAMGETDWNQGRTLIDRVFGEIDDFTERVQEGLYSEAQIRNYSQGFVRGSKTAYEQGNASSYGLPELPQYPGDGNTACKVGCQCHLVIVPLEGTNWDVYWTLGIAEHCKDCLRLARTWNPLRIRNGSIIGN